MLKAARGNLWKMQERFNYFPDLTVVINGDFVFNFSGPLSASIADHPEQELPEPYLKCTLDPTLLEQILNRERHWNNAEVGCLITFDRAGPYMPDCHTLLSFFHTPREV